MQLDFEQILCCANQADSPEYSEIIGILDDKEILGKFLVSIEDRISPPGYAALWLHGKKRNFW